MTDIEKVKNNELFIKAVKAARELFPQAKLYTNMVESADSNYASLFIDGVSYEDCDKVGCAVLPDYDYIEAGNFRQPLYVDIPIPGHTDKLIDVTNMEV